jgi:hypothetical protein
MVWLAAGRLLWYIPRKATVFRHRRSLPYPIGLPTNRPRIAIFCSASWRCRWTSKDKDLDALRDREDFKKLQAELEKSAPPVK